MSSLPRRQRVAAYAVIVRDGAILLSRLAQRVTKDELWTLPGGGLDHGEDPRDAVVREVREETGLEAEVGDAARVYSAHLPGVWRDGRRVDAHALRIVYEGRVAPDAPAPHVVEVDGSTMDAAWVPLADVTGAPCPSCPWCSRPSRTCCRPGGSVSRRTPWCGARWPAPVRTTPPATRCS
ncbi:NUDIX hydrolase [Nocardioides zeae]